ncbi:MULTISPECIES: flagellar motor protein MotB [unclassified Aureispira]|uniref:OmpA/MotB family protein n=1 Tax=unclassified Aureispira TaxID=2649989 RepID=UPI0006985596|nr:MULTISPECIES: flagellar motor protein MotB [unclassified Aureispira]WMX16290.1 flagellar motor protein MotB [Aureispira sp. CCB-E]
MNFKYLIVFLALGFGLTSCVGKKKYTSLQTTLEASNKDVDRLTKELSKMMRNLDECKAMASADAQELMLRQEQIKDLRNQIADLKKQRQQQYSTVGDLTVLSKSANENMKETLRQLEEKDEYIKYIQAARTKADSLNLALAVNLKSVLKDGIEDEDIDVQVDKTVVFVNLSDKMLYNSGSYELTDRASTVLGKIAKIVKAKPNFEVMVEGYTDNVPMNGKCVTDNWDLSVKRSTSVVRALQEEHNVDPNRLIAAGRGEYNALVSNDTSEGRATNRRTRIIILPKLDQFYELLNPKEMPN